jgi:hypothetical protein
MITNHADYRKAAAVAVVALVGAAVSPALAEGQDSGTSRAKAFSAAAWCADSGTACWSDADRRKYLNGVRVVADLDLGFLFQTGRNRFEGTLKGNPKVTLEWNLIGGWVAFQLALTAPGTMQFDDRSPAVSALVPRQKQERQVHYNWGGMVGLALLDGGVSVGLGRVSYDRRDFRTDTTLKKTIYRDSFGYVALQPISSIRANIKNSEDRQP